MTNFSPRLLPLLLLLLDARFASAQVPPGNALSFVSSTGIGNEVDTGTELPDYNNNFTVEAWVRTGSAPRYISTFVNTGDNFYLGMYGYNAAEAGKAVFHVHSTFIFSNTFINDGKWHHLAGVNDHGAAALYVDGVLEATGSGYGLNYSGDPSLQLRLSSYAGNSQEFSLDEVRIWNAARTAAQVKAAFNNVVTPLPQAGLDVYYNFDQGTAGGANAGVNTLPNLGSLPGYTGTLSSNFTLSGSTSNWLESYALMQPTNLTASSNASGTSLSVSWTAPPVGTVTNYVLDCATTADFSAGLTTLTPAGSATSATITGRTPNTRYWLRLRADKTSVTGQSAYSRDVTNLRTASGLTPPGNALAFDGVDDYVALPTTTPVPTGNGTYTLEAWIKPNAMGVYGIIGWGNWGTTNQVNALRLSPTGIINYWWGPDLIVSTPDLSGRWHHVAATFDGTTRTIYLDGVAVGSDTPGGHTVPSPGNLRIGCTNGPSPGGGYEYFNGSLDEVRIWSVARSAAQIKAAYTSWPAVPQAGLVAAYDFDQGTAGGANAGQTTLVDRSNNYQDGTLANFSLASGNATSNFVESYATVVPSLMATTGATTTGFTATWAAPLVGTVTGYVLDYSLSPTFASGVTSQTLAAGATSQAITGLLPNRNYYLRLRADKTSLTGQGAYASCTARPLSGQTPPGNALAFDGVNDYVAVSASPATNNLAPAGGFTLETWVYVTTTTVHSLIRKDGDYNLYLNAGGVLACDVWPGGPGTAALTSTTATTALAANRWYHVAATWSGTATKLYLNGVDVTGTATPRTGAATAPLQLGGSATYGQYLTGRLDETRLYNAALTAAQVQADMTSTSAALPASLLLYYNYDHGTAGGNNAAITTLTDQSSSPRDGTLTNFDLSSGNTTSNWVESYALVVPGLTAATGVSSTGFTANWTAPALGIVDNGYRLDVATSNAFTAASLVAGSPITVAGTSQAVTGLNPSQTYYYRVRADKTSVTGQGAYAPTAQQAPFSPMPPPGNALAFDGVNDYVSGTNPQLPQGNAARTLEAWVLTTAANGVILNYGTASTNQRSGLLVSSGHLYYVGEFNDLPGSKSFNDGRWHHVAATWDGTTLRMYVDGVLDVSSALGAFGTTGFNWRLGSRIMPDPATTQEQYTGRLDEARVYSVALTQAQIQADMASTNPAVPASLVAYYNFDHGTPGGDNAGYTSLADQSASASSGTLNNFNLGSGNTTSNWVESYALLQPTGLAATAPANGTSLNVTWTAPTINGAAPAAGIVEGYVLDVSTSSTFASAVTSFPVSGYATTSTTVTGLANGTNYFLRVRAEKASVSTQGTYSTTFATHTIGTDALLASLTVSVPGLSPTFASGTLAYMLYVPTGTSTYTLTPTASNSYTSITVNGTAVASGTASAALSVGSTVTIVVTSEDLNTTRTYTVQTAVAPTFFRSVATGNWGDANTWEASYDGSTGWFANSVAPSGSFVGTATVRSGHVVTVAAATSTKTTTIESGGFLNTLAGQTLSIPSGATMTVSAGGVLSIGRLNGPDGVTGTSTNLGTLSVAGANALTVNGTLVLNTGGSTPASQGISSTTTTVGSGGRVVQFATAANLAMPAPTWQAGSTLELAGGVTNQAYANISQTLQNLEVNLSTLPVGSATTAQPYLLTNPTNVTVAGTLTVRSTGQGTLRLMNATGGALTLGSVDGSGNRSGGYVQLAGTSVIGSFGGVTSTNGAAITVQGNFQLNGGTYAVAQPSSTTGTSLRAIPMLVYGDFAVASGATLLMMTATTGPTVGYPGGGIVLNGNFSNAGTVTSGNTASFVGQRISINKAGGVQFFTNSGTISGVVGLQVVSGATLDLAAQVFTGAGAFNMVAGSTLRLGSPDGISVSGTATGNVQTTGPRTFAAGSNFEFNGLTAQTTGTGFPTAALSAASTLTFNNPAGVTLAQALTVPGTLRLQQGPVTSTATNLLTLGTGTATPGTLNATAGNTGRVVGPFRRWVAASTGPRDFPVGTATTDRPATINFTTAPTTGGTLTAEFIAEAAGSQGLPLTENGITINKAAVSGYWRVAAADGLAGGTYTPTFTFTGALGVLDYTQLVLLKRADPSADWALVGASVATTGSNAAPVLSRTGVTGFSDFTAGGDLTVNPLPVELLSFKAERQGSSALLRWNTASEKNSARFDIERSADGQHFEKIGEEQAQGTAARATAYTFLDPHTPIPSYPHTLYYRLRQVDADGTFSYSPVRVVVFGKAATWAAGTLHAAPNPFQDLLTLTLDLPQALTSATLRLTDATGRVLLQRDVAAPAGASQLALPGLAGLAPGFYVLRLAAPGQPEMRLKVVKEY